ncbi:MAG: hypothetical protein KKH98_03960 [Spirochaetes bacterium]|nr:hypothetical protein [Spirochaetota bacterium]
MENIYNFIEETAERLGFRLVELNINDKYKKMAITIYKPTGVSIDDCEKLNKELIDDIEFIENYRGVYDLEISSPGTDRIFKDIKEYSIFVGKEVKIVADTKEVSSKVFTGVLKGIDKENNILVEKEYDLLKIPYNSIKKGGLLFE